jgi:hypothetical protein
VQPFEGSINFGNDSNNPLDSRVRVCERGARRLHVVRTGEQLPEGRYVYRNKDAYVQDNWKMTGKLTLDYGMRFTHHGPQYDQYPAIVELLPREVVGGPGAEALRAGLLDALFRQQAASRRTAWR